MKEMKKTQNKWKRNKSYCRSSLDCYETARSLTYSRNYHTVDSSSMHSACRAPIDASIVLYQFIECLPESLAQNYPFTNLIRKLHRIRRTRTSPAGHTCSEICDKTNAKINFHSNGTHQLQRCIALPQIVCACSFVYRFYER